MSANKPWRAVARAELLASSSPGSYDVLGEVPTKPRLAIVGARAAHRRALARVPEIVAAAGARGWAVVSGGARGIDRAVHEAALRAQVPQLAVLPCARDELYPPEHRGLFRAIVDSGVGALICAYAPGQRFGRGMFVGRNSVMVALADAVVVVEAALRSGSIQTGQLALRRSRPLGVVLGSPGTATLLGCGASALGACGEGDITASTEAWLDSLAGVEGTGSAGPAWPSELAWLRDCFAELGPGEFGLDDLAGRSGRVLATVALAVIEAEALGFVVEAAPGRYVAVAG